MTAPDSTKDSASFLARVVNVAAECDAEGRVTHRVVTLEPSDAGPPRCGPPVYGHAPSPPDDGVRPSLRLPEAASRGVDVGTWVRVEVRAATELEAARGEGERRAGAAEFAKRLRGHYVPG